MNLKTTSIAIFVVLIILVTVCQFLFGFPLRIQPNYNSNNLNNSGDTMESISNSLNEIQDNSSLGNDSDSLDESIEGL